MQTSPIGSRWLLDDEQNRAVVDGLRALGIILVVAFHGAFVFAKVLPRPALEEFVLGLPPVLNIIWQALGSEVVFFTSGFLLSYLLLREQARYGSIDVRDFYIRRLSRIVPLFLLALVVFMIGRRFHWDRLLSNLLFSARVAGELKLSANSGKNYIPVGWSLEVMVHAYLLLPLLVRFVLCTRWPLTTSLLLAAVSVAPRYFALVADPAAWTMRPCDILDVGEIPDIHKDLYYLTWFRLTPFLIGLAAAVAATHHRDRLLRWFASAPRANASMIAGIALVAASGFLPLQKSTSFVYDLFGQREWIMFWSCQRAVLILGCAVLLLAALATQRGPAALLARGLGLRCFGPVSHGIYSIYLFHFACLIPAALLVFLPAVVQGIAASPTWNRKVLLEHMTAAVTGASVWQYLLMVAVAVYLSTKLADFLTKVVEAPVRNWLKTRLASSPRQLLPEVASAERDSRSQLPRHRTTPVAT